MKIGILVAMEEEIRRLTAEVSKEEQFEIANQKFYDGEIHGVPVIIVQAGIGKVNAAVATSLLIDHFKADLVINTGSAGAIAPGLKIGDLVIADQLSYNDVDNRVFDYQYGQIPQMDAFFVSDSEINNKIKIVAENNNWQVDTGLIVSGDSFISNQKSIEEIRTHFPTALVTEMEGAAVGQTCAQYDIPFTVIRAVSDTADEEADIDFDEFVLEAGKKSAELVMALLEKVSS